MSGPLMMPNDAGYRPLRLKAQDADDLTVISTVLQDAIVPVSDVGFFPDDGLFAMVVNRFRWETLPDDAVDSLSSTSDQSRESASVSSHADSSNDEDVNMSDLLYERVNCGVRFRNVNAAATRGLDASDRGRILNLLSVTWADSKVLLQFSGGTDIALTVSDLMVCIEDVGDPWPTSVRPGHGGNGFTDTVHPVP